MTQETFETIPIPKPRPTVKNRQNVCLDKGYDYDEVRALLKEFKLTAHIRARGEEAELIRKSAWFKARRWVVERTHSWMNRIRPILVRWEKKVRNYLSMLHLVCGLITWRAAGLFER